MATEHVNNQINQANSSSSSKKKYIIGGVATIAVVAGVSLFVFLNQDTEEYNVVVTADNVEETIRQQSKDDYTPIGSYTSEMTTDTWIFADGNSASDNAYVGNNISNQNTVYFTITRTDNDEQLYKSPFLEVGSHLEKIKLDKSLKAGTYDCVLTYYLMDDMLKEENSHVSVAVKISIKK